MLDLQMFELRCIRLVGMLVGVSLLCLNAWAMPAAGSAVVGLGQASEQGLVEGGEAGGGVDSVSSSLVEVSPVEVSPVAGVSDRERRLRKRLVTVAVFGGVVLLLLAVVCGYFRLELTTRGFYSGRLQIVSGIASLVVVTAAYFLWRWLVG